MSEVGVALIGTAFMGRAHSNAWRQVAAFCSPPLTPRLKVICGRSRERTESAARAFGWEHSFTHMVHALLEAMAAGAVPSPSFHDGVMNQRVLDAVGRASQSRRWVRVKGVA